MDEATRLLYLEAMGITQWQLKTPSLELPISGGNPPDLSLSAPPTLDNTRYDPAGKASATLSTNTVSTPAPLLEALGWEHLQAAVAACTKCGLCKTRTQTVFGNGNKNADWLLIGEAPGQQEDLQGLPFVGPAGQLLTEMLRAIGLSREVVYITNILKCRPPGNRDPEPNEAEKCRPYLERQIALIKPKIILAVGRIAAQTLLHTDAPVSRLRGKVHTLNQIPVVVVYHPSYLLRSPLEKKKAWLDLQLALSIYQKL